MSGGVFVSWNNSLARALSEVVGQDGSICRIARVWLDVACVVCVFSGCILAVSKLDPQEWIPHEGGLYGRKRWRIRCVQVAAGDGGGTFRVQAQRTANRSEVWQVHHESWFVPVLCASPRCLKVNVIAGCAKSTKHVGLTLEALSVGAGRGHTFPGERVVCSVWQVERIAMCGGGTVVSVANAREVWNV